MIKGVASHYKGGRWERVFIIWYEMSRLFDDSFSSDFDSYIVSFYSLFNNLNTILHTFYRILVFIFIGYIKN
ncbi:MAG: hypothetical protein ACFFAQ_01975 [Promethearchaeota archaeon]